MKKLIEAGRANDGGDGSGHNGDHKVEEAIDAAEEDAGPHVCLLYFSDVHVYDQSCFLYMSFNLS